MKYVLFLVMILFSGQAVALNCEKQPTCEELNYSKEDNPKCDKNGYILCPYDQSYKKCVNFNCESLGFTKSDKSDWCADIAHCKTDETFTACQSPCFATTYEEFSNLAESGKCKIITMKNDITIPLNESLTLAENTVIDGGGHTLTSSSNQAEHIVVRAKNNTGMKNIKIRHTADNLKEFSFLIASADDTISLENMDILISSDDNTTVWSAVFNDGTYNIRGKFALDIEAKRSMVGFFRGTYNFTDAQVYLKGNHAIISDTVDLTFTNATIQLETLNSLFMARYSVTFQNSEANLKGGYLFYAIYHDLNLILKEDANVRLELYSLYSQGNQKAASITLKGTAENPAVLKMKYSGDGAEKTNIVATNTTDKFILNGVTYRPKQIGTTKLSEIPNSQNWEKVQ